MFLPFAKSNDNKFLSIGSATDCLNKKDFLISGLLRTPEDNAAGFRHFYAGFDWRLHLTEV
jgi:hypothetical protein